MKFADVTPTLEECERALSQAERVVRATMPDRRRRRHASSQEARARESSASSAARSSRSARSRRWRWRSSVRSLARGDAWRTRDVDVPGRARSGRIPRRPMRSAGWARAGWCVLLAGDLLAVPYVVWRMTLGADARVPRLGLPTIAPLVLGPRGWRTPLRDVPGMLRGAALVMAVLALGRPQNVLRGETRGREGHRHRPRARPVRLDGRP